MCTIFQAWQEILHIIGPGEMCTEGHFEVFAFREEEKMIVLIALNNSDI